MSNTVTTDAEVEPKVEPTQEASDQVTTTEPETEDFDPDQADLDEAKAAAEADEGEGEEGGEGTPDPEPEPGAAPTGDAAVAPGDGKPAPDPEPAAAAAKDQPMIPKARFDEVAKQRDDALMAAAYHKGQADQIAKQPGEVDPAEAAKTPDQALADLKAKKLDLAEELDEGQLTQREYAEKLSDLDDQEFEVRKVLLAPAPTSVDSVPEQETDLYLETVTAELEQAHPYLALIGDPGTDPLAKERFDHLAATARATLAAEGETITNNARGTLLVRQKVAELSDGYGKLWFPDAQVGEGQQQTAQPGQADPQKGADGLTASQRATKNKVGQAAAHPPNTLNIGAGEGQQEDAAADATRKIESGEFSEDDIAALPDALKKQIRGDSW